MSDKKLSLKFSLVEFKEQYPDASALSDSQKIEQYIKAALEGSAAKLNININNDDVSLEWVYHVPDTEADMLNKNAIKFVRNKEPEKALELWAKAFEVENKNPDFYYNCSLTYFEIKDYKGCLDNCLQSISVCPVYARSYFVLGTIYTKLRQFDNVLKYLKLGLLYDSTNSKGWVRLGTILTILKQYGEAVNAFERATSVNPKECEAFLGLGKIYAANQDFDNATRCFKVVIKLDPDGKLGKIARDGLVQITPKQTLVNTEVTNVKQPDEIEQSTPTEQVEFTSEELYAKAQQAFVNEDFGKSCYFFEKYLGTNSTDADAWATLAYSYIRNGDKTKAIENIKEAIKLDSNNPSFHKEAAIIYDICGITREAGREAQKAYELGVKDSTILALLGKKEYYIENYQASVEFLKESVKLNKNNLNAHYHLGMALKGSGQTQLARQEFEEILWSQLETPLTDMSKQALKG